jgi:NifU-like protein
MIEETVRANGLRTVEDVTNYTKAGGGCASCHEGIEEILTKVLAEQGETFQAEPVKQPAKEAAAASAGGGMTTLQRIRRIERVIESIRPQLQADHGDVELIDVDGPTVYVKMTGACSGCQMASMTLGGIQQRLMEDLGEFIKVVPANQPQAARAGG